MSSGLPPGGPPPFSVCPFRSPVVPPGESKIVRLPGDSEPQPKQYVGPCLGRMCGLWVDDMDDQGNIKGGMCSIKLAAPSIFRCAGALDNLSKLKTLETLGDKPAVN